MNEKRGDGSGESSRRNFIKKLGAGIGTVSISGIAGTSIGSGEKTKSGEKIKLLSPEGKLVEVDKDDIKPARESVAELPLLTWRQSCSPDISKACARWVGMETRTGAPWVYDRLGDTHSADYGARDGGRDIERSLSALG